MLYAEFLGDLSIVTTKYDDLARDIEKNKFEFPSDFLGYFDNVLIVNTSEDDSVDIIYRTSERYLFFPLLSF